MLSTLVSNLAQKQARTLNVVCLLGRWYSRYRKVRSVLETLCITIDIKHLYR
jgi:hypothetical protein